MTRRRDSRLRGALWSAGSPGHTTRFRTRLLVMAALPLAVYYFAWLLQPDRVGHPVLFGLLVAAELFNVIQAIGFWWTAQRERVRKPLMLVGDRPPVVDLFVPVYDEPVEVVEPTIAAAVGLQGADVRVALLDDGRSPAMRRLAERYGARYIAREGNRGAKAGNINNALEQTDGQFVAVLDCDHVPLPRFLMATLGHLADERVAFVQTPQYYANCDRGDIQAAAWSQQSLFFGAIARGKDGHDAMFCCGTNVIFSREALESVGGFPENSVTEDFELSVRLHEQGWRTAYVPEVLAHGLGPEDMASYVSQQQRWARGCLSAIPAVLRARLPFRQKVQYLLSATFFLSGWTVLVYMTFPVVRIATGAQPLAAASADQFLLHFAPYFGLALYFVAAVGGGSYTFHAFALQAASFWIHVQASVRAVLRRPGKFVVTPKQGAAVRQPRAVLPALVAIAVLAVTIVYGLLENLSPATLNNVAFAAVHLTVLSIGVLPALRLGAHAADIPAADPVADSDAVPERERAAA
jgi:cellulose synthase (UDP-forming)